MNTQLRILCTLVLIGAFLLPTAGAGAQATRIEFSGTEICDMASLTAERVWEAGPNFFARGWTQTCYDTSDNPMMTGTAYLSGGLANIGSHYIVNVKMRMETSESGTWEGTCVMPANTDEIHCVAHGGGAYEGLEMFEITHPSSGELVSFSGYILDHRN